MDGSRGVSIIINNKTTEWLEDPLLYTDEAGRLMVTRIIVKGVSLTIANVYAPADTAQRIPWFTATAEALENNPLPYVCDLIGGDFNHSTSMLDRRTRQPPPQRVIRVSQRLINALRRDECDCTDGWRE